MEHDQNMVALNNHLQMTRLRQQKRYVTGMNRELFCWVEFYGEFNGNSRTI